MENKLQEERAKIGHAFIKRTLEKYLYPRPAIKGPKKINLLFFLV